MHAAHPAVPRTVEERVFLFEENCLTLSGEVQVSKQIAKGRGKTVGKTVKLMFFFPGKTTIIQRSLTSIQAYVLPSMCMNGNCMEQQVAVQN